MTSRVCVYVMTSLLLAYASEAGPVRDTVNGKVEGVTKTGFTKGDVDFFYGIPFAKPPLGSLRFEDPVEPVSWSTTRQATKLPTSCPQIDDDVSYVAMHRAEVKDYGEDCLYLNVFQPKTSSKKLAVLLFIHGGSNVVGSGLMFDGGYLASHGNIIVVTMNYRLAALGFLGTGQSGFPGNYAMMDQIMSMKWVKNNIAFFNGDPDKVTILGHSAGSFDVGLHLLSPLSKGLFRAVISQSGPPTSPIAWKHPRADPLEEARNISGILGCTATTAVGIKECLKKAKLDDLMKGRFEYAILDAYEFPAIVDGHFLPEDPISLMKKKKFSASNYAIGVTVSECDYFAQNTKTYAITTWLVEAFKATPSDVDVSGLLTTEYTNAKTKGQKYSEIMSCSDMLSDAVFIADTIRSANLLADGGVNVHMYQWARRPDKGDFFVPWFRVPHGIDLFYLFGSPISGHPKYTFTQVDKDMSKYMMDSWSNYVKSGALGPSSGSPASQSYDSQTRAYLRFGVKNGQPQMSVLNNLAPKVENFWLKELPKQIKQLRKNKGSSKRRSVRSSSKIFLY